MGPIGHSLAALAAVVGAPAVTLGWALRPAWRGHLPERLGGFPAAGGASPVWIHGASVGETIAADGLVGAFVAAGEDVVTSTVTPTGRAVARARRPAVPSGLAPLDHPWIVARALDRVRPSVLVLVETEIWPAWIRAAAERGVPIVMVSARISDRSFPRYRKLRGLLRSTLARVSAVGARSELDAERFIALGVPQARVEVTGDLKLEPGETKAVLPADLAWLLGETPLWVAGSTHAGEEEAALGALAVAEQAGHSLVLVVAPRHPERWDEVASVLEASGRRVVRRSRVEGGPLVPGEVLLLDSLGELQSLWPRASVAFVGGSLTAIGGHNVLEPVQVGRAVLFGPYTQNAREAAERVLESGAGVRVGDAHELAGASLSALQHPDAWRARGEAGRRALAAHRGATVRSLALIERVRNEARA